MGVQAFELEGHVTQLDHEGLFANDYLMRDSYHRELVRILDQILQQTEYMMGCFWSNTLLLLVSESFEVAIQKINGI
jgi:hypothetical protein